MSTIATMGMRSFLFFLAILPAIWAADNETLNATNVLTNNSPLATATNSAPTSTASTNSEPQTAAKVDPSIEAARAILAKALSSITNAPIDPRPSSNVVAPVITAPNTNQAALAAINVPLDVLDEVMKLHAGDIVRYRVQEDREEVKRLNITDGGELEIPYLGHIKAAGKTCKELALEVKALLEKDLYHRATVNIAIETVMRKSLGKIMVFGAVARPGPHDIPPDQDKPWTVSDAVLFAGPTEYANKGRVKLIKKNLSDDPKALGSAKNPILVDVDEIFKKGRSQKDQPVEPGDTIIVDTLLIKFQ